MAKTVRERPYAQSLSALGVKFPEGTDERLKAFEYYKTNHARITKKYAGKYVAIGPQGVVKSEKERRRFWRRSRETCTHYTSNTCRRRER